MDPTRAGKIERDDLNLALKSVCSFLSRSKGRTICNSDKEGQELCRVLLRIMTHRMVDASLPVREKLELIWTYLQAYAAFTPGNLISACSQLDPEMTGYMRCKALVRLACNQRNLHKLLMSFQRILLEIDHFASEHMYEKESAMLHEPTIAAAKAVLEQMFHVGVEFEFVVTEAAADQQPISLATPSKSFPAPASSPASTSSSVATASGDWTSGVSHVSVSPISDGAMMPVGKKVKTKKKKKKKKKKKPVSGESLDALDALDALSPDLSISSNNSPRNPPSIDFAHTSPAPSPYSPAPTSQALEMDAADDAAAATAAARDLTPERERVVSPGRSRGGGLLVTSPSKLPYSTTPLQQSHAPVESSVFKSTLNLSISPTPSTAPSSVPPSPAIYMGGSEAVVPAPASTSPEPPKPTSKPAQIDDSYNRNRFLNALNLRGQPNSGPTHGLRSPASPHEGMAVGSAPPSSPIRSGISGMPLYDAPSSMAADDLAAMMERSPSSDTLSPDDAQEPDEVVVGQWKREQAIKKREELRRTAQAERKKEEEEEQQKLRHKEAEERGLMSSLSEGYLKKKIEEEERERGKGSTNNSTNITESRTLALTFHYSIFTEFMPYEPSFACPGCGRRVTLPEKRDKSAKSVARFCEYTGRHFCSSCHKNDERVLPGFVVKRWDFTKRRVCALAADYLDDMYTKPCVDLREMDLENIKNLGGSKEKQTARMMHYRAILARQCEFVLTCRGDQIQTLMGLLGEEYLFLLTAEVHIYTMQALVAASKDKLKNKIKEAVHVNTKHITKECELCKGKGSFCAGGIADTHSCKHDKKGELVFPFQLDTCSVCAECNAVFHKQCALEGNQCPKCRGVVSDALF